MASTYNGQERRRGIEAEIAGYVVSARGRDAIERAACFVCFGLFSLLAWIAVDPHGFRGLVLWVLS